MKRNLLISFLAVLALIFVMRWQGSALITPLSPKGMIDLEFARTAERYQQLRLFLDMRVAEINLYIDFVFIAAYTWFLINACNFIASRTRWRKWSAIFNSFAITAALFDVCENFLLLLVFYERFSTRALEIVFYCAIIKFALAAFVILYLLISWPFVLKARKGT